MSRRFIGAILGDTPGRYDGENLAGDGGVRFLAGMARPHAGKGMRGWVRSN